MRHLSRVLLYSMGPCPTAIVPRSHVTHKVWNEDPDNRCGVGALTRRTPKPETEKAFN
jgi:hypothetical protein